MNLLILLATGLIFVNGDLSPFGIIKTFFEHNLTLSDLIPLSKPTEVLSPSDNFTVILHVVNRVKHLLSDGEHDFKITWDESLAAMAAKHVEECPMELRSNEFYGDFDELLALGVVLNSSTHKTFSLSSLPTRAVLRNKSMELQLDIGSRIGCSLGNCSHDFLCHFEARRSAQLRLQYEPCEHDTVYPNMCIEKPFDYSQQDCDEFGKTMMGTWNEHRRTVAKAFNVPAMYELCWSNELKATAEVIAANCTYSDVSGRVYAHPRSLEPLHYSSLLSHQLPSSEVFPPTLPAILAPNQNLFGCAPTNSTTCHEYSYYCVIGPEMKSTEIEPETGNKLCGECSGDCFDGLCRPRIVEEKPEEEVVEVAMEPEKLEIPKEKSSTMTTIYLETWKVWTLAVCVFICTVIAFFLICTLVTTDYS